MNAGGPARGGGSGRARGSGRGGGSSNSRGGANNGVPLAAQMRQVTRLQEPDEMAVLRRYRDVGASQVRSVYGATGLLDREIQVSAEAINRLRPNAGATAPTFVPVLVADNALGAFRQEQERERALARREVRLPEARRRVSWTSLSPEERRVLLLSQKEYNSFRASRGDTTAASAAATVPVSPAQAARPPAPARAPTPAKQT